jgi:hypothetical protein
MIDTSMMHRRCSAALISSIALSIALSLPAYGADSAAVPAVLTIAPPGRTNPQSSTVSVTLTPPSGSAFGSQPAATDFKFVPPVISIAQGPTLSSDKKSITATFKLTENATGLVRVTLENNQTIYAGNFDTGVVCLESLQSTGCALRWEVITSSATGSTSQTKTQTSPNILFKLDYQFRSPKQGDNAIAQTKKFLNATDPSKQSSSGIKLAPADFKEVFEEYSTAVGLEKPAEKTDTASTKTAGSAPPQSAPGKQGNGNQGKSNFMAHAVFTTGYTQVPATTNLQTSTTSGGTASPSAAVVAPRAASSSGGSTTQQCTSSSSSAPSSSASGSTGTCTSATQQQAFIADLKITAGWTAGQNGQGVFSEFGFGARGSIQDLIQANQIVQNGSIQYVDLSAANLKNTSAIYEAVGRYRLSSIGHDAPASSSGKYNHNASDLLLIEAGYQNNSALQGLAANPATSTRSRFVLRFSAYPEIPGTNHTKALVGFEYSGGINGGARVMQLFFGGNLNLPKLFQSGAQTSPPPSSAN